MSLALWLFACSTTPSDPVDDTIDGVFLADEPASERSALAEEPVRHAPLLLPVVQAEPPQQPQSPSVTLGPCASPDCEVTLVFGEPMRTDVLPMLSLSPDVPGQLRWRDDRTLVLTPRKGALGHGTELAVTVEQAAPLAHPELAVRGWKGTLVVPRFEIAGKVAWWPVVAGEPRFVGFLNHSSLALGTGPLLAIYDQPVRPSELAERLVVTHNDRELPFRVTAAPSLAPYATAEPLPRGHVLAITIQDLPRDGESVIARMPTWEEEGFQSEVWELEVRRTLSIEEASLGVDDRSVDDVLLVPLEARASLRFNGGIEQGIAKGAVTIVPAPPASSITAFATQLNADLTLAPGTDYALNVSPGITDALGNRLGQPFTLRFRSRDLPPELTLPSKPTLSENAHASVELRSVNIDDLVVEAWPLSVTSYIRGLDSVSRCSELAPTGAAVTLQLPARAALNTREDLTLALGGKGLRCVEASAVGRGSEVTDGEMSTAALVSVTDLGLTAKIFADNALVWVTRMSNASVVEGADIELLDSQGNIVTRGTSRSDGVASLAIPEQHRGGAAQLHVVASLGEDTAVLSMNEERLSSPWQFGFKGMLDGDKTLDVSLFSDRGAYRPGEAVHITLMGGPVRAGQSVAVVVTDPRGETLLARDVTLDRFGMGTLDAPTQESSATGRYRIDARIGEASVQTSVQLEEYRVPTFKVTAESAPVWKRDEPVKTSIAAAYLQGGMLDARPFQWSVVRTPERFVAKSFPLFVFGRSDEQAIAASVASGRGRLDGAGRATATFTPSHPSAAGPVRYSVEATVTDIDRSAWSARVSRVVHPAAFYVGVRPPPSAVLHQGDPLDIPIVAVSPDGARVDGVSVKVSIERIDHHSSVRVGTSGAVQSESRPVSVSVSSCSVITAKIPATCHFVVPSAGRWRVVARARDKAGQEVEAGFSFTAGGDTPAPWPRFDRERIAVIADKASYVPGEVAHLVVETPFPEAIGLLTLEAEGVVSHRVFNIRKDTPVLDVPIEAVGAPNMYASVVLLRGRIHDRMDATGFQTGAPSFRMGVVELAVSPAAKHLDVNVVPMRATVAPKDTVDVVITAADANGVPIEGQAVVMVVDEAVLGLTGFATPDPLAGLHPVRPLGVRTADLRLDLPGALRSRHETLFAGGDGADDLGPLPAELLRSLFRSTAFYDAAVPVKAGRATVHLSLPDQSSTFRVMVAAVDTLGRAGSSDTPLLVRRPVSVAAVAPRFLYPGDKLDIEALVHADSAGEVHVATELVGMSAKSSLTGVVRVEAGATARFPVSVEVTGKGKAVIRFAVSQGSRRDAVEVTLPILSPGNSRTEAVSAMLSSAEQQLTLHLPPDRVRGSEHLELVASTTALTELSGAIDYLMDYPNGCIEQTTSRAYPLVVLEDLLPEIGVDIDKEKLAAYRKAGIQRILSFQTDRGGLSYWPGGDEPHAFGTAFGLTALIEARKRGYDIPDEALSRMAEYLIEVLGRDDVTTDAPHGGMADADTRALFAVTLGRLGHPQQALVERLWGRREELTAFGLSMLAVAASEIDPQHPLVQQARAELAATAKRSDNEAWFEGTARGGWSMDSPLRSHAAALLAFAGGGDLGAPLLTGLLARRQNGLWGNTQENVFGVMGVYAMMGAATSTGTGPKLALARNGAPLDLATLASPSPRVRRREWSAAELGSVDEQVISASLEGGLPVNLSLRASYDLELTAGNRAARNEGIEITRRLEGVDGRPIDPGAVALGALVRVRLFVHTSQPLNYVAIDDRLPAGFEPLNTALVATESVEMGAMNRAFTQALTQLSYTETRDHRVAFYMDVLPAGDYELRYVARATMPGTFLRPAARAEAMYLPEVFGATSIDEVVIR